MNMTDRSTLDSVAAPRSRPEPAPTEPAPPTLLTSDTPSTPRKMFIVGRKNMAAYYQLMRTVGQEPGVEIIYDRRRGPRTPGALRRLVARIKRALGLHRRKRRGPGRRERPQVDQELRDKGWAVVRVDEPRRPQEKPTRPTP